MAALVTTDVSVPEMSTTDIVFEEEVQMLEAWETSGELPDVGVLLALVRLHMRDQEACRRGNSVLHLAAWYETSLAVVQRLLSAGADPNRRNIGNGFTSMHVAAVRSCPKVMKLLIDAKADVNALAHNGWPPLMFTVYRQRLVLETVSLLLANGASPALKAKNGKCAVELARDNNREDLVVVMERSMMMLVLTSCSLVPRLGRQSTLKAVPKELIRCIDSFLYKC